MNLKKMTTQIARLNLILKRLMDQKLHFMMELSIPLLMLSFGMLPSHSPLLMFLQVLGLSL